MLTACSVYIFSGALLSTFSWYMSVMLTECADGYFGEQCEYQCHCADRSDVCDKTTGRCQSGCAAGWSGLDCQTGNYCIKKATGETQTLCTGCSKVEPKCFTSPQTPFPGARDGQNLITWRWSLPLPTDPVW